MIAASISVTGSRLIPRGGAGLIRSALELIPHVLRVSTGAAHGVDTEVFYAALEVFPQAEHRVVYPVGVSCNRKVVEDAEGRGLLVVPVLGPINTKLYLKRNGVLLEGATTVVAFPSAGREVLRSGTWMTVRLARKRGLPIMVFPLDGSPAWTEDGVAV